MLFVFDFFLFYLQIIHLILFRIKCKNQGTLENVVENYLINFKNANWTYFKSNLQFKKLLLFKSFNNFELNKGGIWTYLNVFEHVTRFSVKICFLPLIGREAPDAHTNSSVLRYSTL